MGTLDTSGAKLRFFGLVDEIGASHLPGFVVWLDHKLAEYKANGQLKPDTDINSNEQYPQWIAKALRQNLSFIFSGSPPDAVSSNLSDSDSGSKSVPRKRRRSNKASSFEPDSPHVSNASFSNQASQAVKEEVASSPEPEIIDTTHPAQSVLPSSQSSYSSVPQQPNGSQASLSGFSQTGVTYFDSSQHETSASSVSTSVPSRLYPELTGSVASGNNLYEQTQSQIVSQRHDVSVPAYSATSSFSENFRNTDFDPMSKESAHGLTGTAAAVDVKDSLSKGEEGTAAVSSGGTAEDEQTTQGAQPLGTGKTQEGDDETGIPIPRGPPAMRSTGGFPCTYCEKTFSCRSHAIDHMATHLGQKPYVCPHCNKGFAQSSVCYRHQRTKHPDLNVIKVKSCLER